MLIKTIQLKRLTSLLTFMSKLDDLINIENPYFEGMVNRKYPPELQLNRATASNDEDSFLDLHLSIYSDFVSSKIYDKPDDFDFDVVNVCLYEWWRYPSNLIWSVHFLP